MLTTSLLPLPAHLHYFSSYISSCFISRSFKRRSPRELAYLRYRRYSLPHATYLAERRRMQLGRTKEPQGSDRNNSSRLVIQQCYLRQERDSTLIRVGHLKGMLDLRLIWDDSSPAMLARNTFSYRPTSFITSHLYRSELQALLNAIHVFTTKGELWNIHKWSAALNKQLDEFYWSNPDPSPPGISMHAAHDEAQAVFSSIDVSTSLLNQDTESPPKTF